MLTFVDVKAQTTRPDGSQAVEIPIDRAKIPGGWLVRSSTFQGPAMTFVPDPTHAWNGSSLPQ
jgi:hypothetical protein